MNLKKGNTRSPAPRVTKNKKRGRGVRKARDGIKPKPKQQPKPKIIARRAAIEALRKIGREAPDSIPEEQRHHQRSLIRSLELLESIKARQDLSPEKKEENLENASREVQTWLAQIMPDSGVQSRFREYWVNFKRKKSKPRKKK